MQPQITARVETNLRQLDQQLDRQKSVSRMEVEGGWYAVLRVPAVQTDEALAIRLFEEHSVLVHPGHFYDFPDDEYLVVSLLGRTEEFAEGTRRLIVGVGG